MAAGIIMRRRNPGDVVVCTKRTLTQQTALCFTSDTESPNLEIAYITFLRWTFIAWLQFGWV